MLNPIPQLFFQEIQKQLTFLVTKQDFKGPFSNFGQNNELYIYEVWFLGKNISIEFMLDWRDRSIDCYIAKLKNGNRPEGWLVSEQGDRVRVRLSTWIRGKGIKDRLFSNVNELSFEEQIPVAIGDYVRMLNEYGYTILENSDNVFS